MIRVAVADDDVVVRRQMCSLISCEPDMTLAAEIGDEASLLREVERADIDVLAVDVSMLQQEGAEAIQRLRAVAPRARLLVLSSHAMPEFVWSALHAGAHGYLVKATGLDDLIAAIRCVNEGKRFLDASASAAIGSVG
jgi:two-component system, NarL family, response regulator NreC